MIRERQRSAITGWVMLPILLALAAGALRFLFLALQARDVVAVLAAVLLEVATVVCLGGFVVVNPNEARVLQLFGAYKGTLRTPGLRWASPFYTKKHVSLRVRNFESGKLKVNDFDGNPVEIAAVVVWRVVDTAEAVFEVDNFENYVKVQTEAAQRNLATSYTYDTHDEAQMSLRGHTAAVAEHLKNEIQDRLTRAIEAETRFGVGANFKIRRQHEVMDLDWEVSPVTKQNKDRAWSQLGTSGSGNHFVEFGISLWFSNSDDESGMLYLCKLSCWVMREDHTHWCALRRPTRVREERTVS